MPCTVKLALWNVAIMRFLCSARSPRENRDIKHSGLTLQKKKKRERDVYLGFYPAGWEWM